MNVLTIDDHILFRSGLRFLLADLDENIRFFEADGIEQLPEIDESRVNMVLLDLHLRGASGAEAIEHVRTKYPNAMVVILSSEEDPSTIRQCIDLGACGYIPKASTPELLVQALRLVIAGGIYLPVNFLGLPGSKNTAQLSSTDMLAAGGISAEPKMSPRQKAALLLAIQGKSNKRIAQEMGVVEGTVKLHLSGAYRALGVSNRTEAVFAAAKCGMILTRK